MGKDYIRIDDRLIHGQIVTAWCGHLRINEIVAIDDHLASNKTLQSIMLMGIPKNYIAHVVTMDDAKKIFATPCDGNRLFVTRFPQDLLILKEEIKQCDTVFLGNAGKRPETKYNLNKSGVGVFFASDDDIKLFDELSNSGTKLIYQTVPNSPCKEWADMRKAIKLK